MSTAKQKAEDLVNSYRMILMNEDTDCGEEILCTTIAKQCAVIAVDEIISALDEHQWQNRFVIEFYSEVKTEIEKL